MKCPICHETNFQPLFKTAAATVRQCARCRLVNIDSPPKGNQYNKNYYQSGSKLKKQLEKIWTKGIHKRRWKLIREHRKKGKIIELGCGTGNFLNAENSNHWQKTGVETGRWAYQTIQQYPWPSFNRPLVELKLSANSFTAACAWHVIEHLTGPYDTLQEINRILHKDGWVFLATPNTDSVGFQSAGKNWFHLAPSYHHYLFNAENIKLLLQQTGFRMIKINFPACEFPLDLAHSSSGVHKLTSCYRKLTAAQKGKSETMVVVAQKQ